jgi:hypothetical protein
LPFQNELVSDQHRAVIVYYENTIFALRSHNFMTGKSILKTVPWPILLRTESLPA